MTLKAVPLIEDNLKKTLSTKVLLTCAAVFLSCFLIAALMFDVLRSSYLAKEQKSNQSWLDTFANRLEHRLNATMAVGRGVAAQMALLEAVDQNQLETIVKYLIGNHLEVRHVAIAPHLIISAIYPLPGNEKAIGLNYLNNPQQKISVIKAIESNLIILDGPLDLVQGIKNQLIVRVPVKQNEGSTWGIVSLVVDINELFESAGVNTRPADLTLTVLFDKRIIWGKDQPLSGHALKTFVTVPEGRWQVLLSPKAKWTIPKSTQSFFWLAALFVSSLFSITVYLILQSRMVKMEHDKKIHSILALDPLTRLSSLYQFKINLWELIEESRRFERKFALIILNLNHFKDINSSLSHEIGDYVLKEIAIRIKRCIRRYDLVCRANADEYIITLKDMADHFEVEARAKLISKYLYTPIDTPKGQVLLNSCIGIAMYPIDGLDEKELIQNASFAMHENKKMAQNSVQFFNKDRRTEISSYVHLGSELKQALESNELEIYYQPIFDIQKKQFTKCEALCRWRKSDGKFVSPLDFIPVAERTGLIHELGMWLLDEVLRANQAMTALGLNIEISINRSAAEFLSHKNTLNTIAKVKRFNVEPSNIILEITESLLMSDNRDKLNNFSLLKEAGFQVAIDDFGTGYSAIGYLKRFPVNYIKIDRSFISGINESPKTEVLVRAIVEIAKTFGMQIVAEGVETKEELDVIEKLGCEYAQGYYMSKPIPLEQLLEFLTSN